MVPSMIEHVDSQSTNDGSLMTYSVKDDEIAKMTLRVDIKDFSY